MNKFIKQVIEEKFASKKQQKYFYAKANDKSTPKKERKKWSKWAKEYSSDTDFEKIPDEVKEKEVEEVVDNLGNYIKGEKFGNLDSKGVTSNSTSDEVVKTSGGQMGTHGVHGTHTSLRYWAEADMSKALGYEDTLGQDEDYDDAKDHFEDDLGLDEPEAEERLAKMGYDKKLPDDKVRLVENPRKFVEEYLESILSKKTDTRDFVKKTDIEEKEINPIILKQINSLKNTLKNNNISINDILKHLKDGENVNEIFDSKKKYEFSKSGEKISDNGEIKTIKYVFITKNKVVYNVIIRIRLKENIGVIDFEATKKHKLYSSTNTDDYDVINVFNTIIEIIKLHSNDVKQFYISSDDQKRIKFYKNIATKEGFKTQLISGNSFLIYTKNNE